MDRRAEPNWLNDHRIVVVPIEDEAFAVVADCGLLLHLNATARLIVEGLVRGDSQREVSENLADLTDGDPSEIAQDVRRLVSHVANECQAASLKTRDAPKPVLPLATPTTDARYRLLGRIVHIVYANQEIAAACHPALSPFCEASTVRPDLTVTFEDDGRSYRVKCGSAAVSTIRTGRAAFSGLMRALVFHDQPNPGLTRVLLHAGSIVGSNGSWIIGGDSGQGKSTLVAKLDALGNTVLGDDLTPIDPKKRVSFPYPMALSIKRHGWDIVAKFRPDLLTSEPRTTSIGKHVRFLAPMNPPQDGDRRGHRICGLLLPNRTAGAAPEIRPIGLRDSMIALCDKYGRFPIDPQDLVALISLVGDIPRYELVYDDVDELIPRLADLL